MPDSPSVSHAAKGGATLHAILPLSTLRSLDDEGIAALDALGIRSVGELLHWDAVHKARTLLTLSRGVVARDVNVAHVLDANAEDTPWAMLPDSPVAVIKTVGPPTGALLERVFAIRTVRELANFVPFVEAEEFLASSPFVFHEPSSAPAELVPKPTGAVISTMRYTTFVREVDLEEDVRLTLSPAVLESVPVSGIFADAASPPLSLGYAAGHTQKWISAGTHLGEVIHSLPLAPGESRNIAIVDWKRRQLSSRDEHATVREQVDSTQVHKRALDEVARAVAEEHQYGKTEIEANTAATSGSFVAAGAVAGGVAGGVVGAIGGGVTGLLVDSALLGSDVGAGTLFGTIAGGAAGTVVGAAAGAAAGGLIYSGASAMGLIKSASEGDRDVLIATQQSITASTLQKSSAIRSLWSTIVVEDDQSEGSSVRTANVTNYNHMHALTIQYYEVLQQYRTVLSLGSVKPLLFLPFQPLNFNFAQIEALWPYLKQIARKALAGALIDDAFAVLPPPPEPVLPDVPGTQVFDPEAASVTRLAVRTKTDLGLNGVTVSLVTRGGAVISVPAVDHAENSVNVSGLRAQRVDHFEVQPDVLVKDVQAIRVHKSAGSGASVRVSVQYVIEEGSVSHVHASWRSLGKRSFETSLGNVAQNYDWGIYSELLQAKAVADEGVGTYDSDVADQRKALLDHQLLIDGREYARDQLVEFFRWRRYQFTRAILEQVEPQQLARVFEALVIETEHGTMPLRRIAHVVPLGTTGSSFVFELKRNRSLKADKPHSGMKVQRRRECPLLQRVKRYADELLSSFEQDQCVQELTENVFLPTSGVFAEAILGRANAAEKLDMTRFYNWQDSPIPNAAPSVQDPNPSVDRSETPSFEVTTPGSTINLVNPVSFPALTGLTGALGAVQNGAMFRDMSKASELTGVIGNLSTLATEMGKASSQMTGQAAVQAMRSASEVAASAAKLAETLMKQLDSPAAPAPKNATEKGATMVQLERMLSEARARSAGASLNDVPGDNEQASVTTTREITPRELQDAQLDTLGVGDPLPASGAEAFHDVPAPQRDVLGLNQRVPDVAEALASAAIVAPIHRGTPGFDGLVENNNSEIVFKDEEGTGADRHMTSRLSARLDVLAILVGAEWPGARLRVTEAWDEDGEHSAGSLHLEGRAADLTVWMGQATPTDTSKLGRLAQLCVDAGFDWVLYEDSAHIHASVKPGNS